MSWDHRICPVDHPARWSRYHPGSIALEGAGVRWSWAELESRVARTASWLVEDLGLQRGDRIALLARNHPDFFVLAYACWRTGLVLAPLSWRLARPELDALLTLCAPRLLLVDDQEHAASQRLSWEGPRHRTAELETLPDRPSPDVPASGLEDPALVLFTSGTTGLPKGAVLPVRQLLFNALNTTAVFGLTGADSTLVYTPLFHTGAINVLALPLLQVGGRVVVHTGFDAGEVLAGVQDGLTAIFGVPTTFQMLLEHPAFEATDRSALRLCLCGGAPLPVSLVRRYQDAGLVLTQGFGMTEAGPNCFYLPPDQALNRAGSVGLPMPTCQAEVRRPDGSRCEPGEVGALWLSGPHLCQGYLGNAEATAKVLVDGWLCTGDLVRTDADGFFYVAGRQKDMFISGGENVYPAEVEVALAGHPGVSECAVVPMSHQRWGEVGCAFWVPRQGEVAAEELKTFLKAHLASYKVPRAFVPVDALPRNASGKVLKAALVQEASRHAC